MYLLPYYTLPQTPVIKRKIKRTCLLFSPTFLPFLEVIMEILLSKKILWFLFICILFHLEAIPGYSQAWFLALCSVLTPNGAQGHPIQSRDQRRVCHEQDKSYNLCAVLSSLVLLLMANSWLNIHILFWIFIISESKTMW